MHNNNMYLRLFKAMLLASLAVVICSCRGDDETIVPAGVTQVAGPANLPTTLGVYLLNEGNMGSNKCTLDYLDFGTGFYRKNIYPETNPTVSLELGDVGNDLQIYGQKLYAVINCSHFVEVMNKNTAKHIGEIKIANCRNIVFDGAFAYVSSYAGPVAIDPNSRLGYVAKIDTATLQVVDTCLVGYQPDGMAIVGGKLFVANSGGYRVPNYDRTVSVIDLQSFTETRKIDVAINLQNIQADAYGRLWVSSRGDNGSIAPNLFVVDSQTETVTDTIGIGASQMWLDGDKLYALGTDLSGLGSASFTLIDTKTKAITAKNFITDGTDKEMAMPYAIAINPDSKEIMVADAKTFVVPGTLYCFSLEGRLKWKTTTGDIPAHIAFLRKNNYK